MTPPQGMADAIAAIWQRRLPETRDRLALLQHAAHTLSETRTLDPEQKAAALDTSHKLAGSLGMYGFTAATEHARLIEQTLDVDHLPQPERLQQHVHDLVASLAGALE